MPLTALFTFEGPRRWKYISDIKKCIKPVELKVVRSKDNFEPCEIGLVVYLEPKDGSLRQILEETLAKYPKAKVLFYTNKIAGDVEYAKHRVMNWDRMLVRRALTETVINDIGVITTMARPEGS